MEIRKRNEQRSPYTAPLTLAGRMGESSNPPWQIEQERADSIRSETATWMDLVFAAAFIWYLGIKIPSWVSLKLVDQNISLENKKNVYFQMNYAR